MKIVDSSLIGEAAYKSSVMTIVARRVEPIVLNLWEKFVKEKKAVAADAALDKDDVVSMVQQATDQVLAEPAGSSLEAARTISLSFMTIELAGVEVGGVCEEVELRIMGLVKASAVATKQLDPMSFETLLGCGTQEGVPTIKIADSLLVKAI